MLIKRQSTKYKHKESVSTFFDSYDYFGTGPPQFKFAGKENLGTVVGFTSTLLVAIAIIVVGGIKANILINKGNPALSLSHR
jgi:hypothetical protein